MSNLPKISPFDPRLTAFALGELEGEDLAAVEAALRDDPAARAAVEEIRALAGTLETALAAEPMPAAPVETPKQPRAKQGQLLRFPQLYYVVGGLAAAAFAILVVRREPHLTPPAKSYSELKIEARAPSETATNAVVDAVAKRTDKTIDVNLPIPAAAPAVTGNVQRVREFAQMPQASGLTTVNQSYATTEQRRERDAQMMAQLKAENAKDAEKKKTDTRQMEVADVSSAPAADANQTEPMAASPSPMVVSGGRLAAPTAPAADKAEEVTILSKFSVAAESKQVADSALLQARPTTGANTEAYAYQRDNDFLGAEQNPLSTFSIDVDTASYANVRRFLAAGQLPPPDAVRIEEMVNYFPYRYASPDKIWHAGGFDREKATGGTVEGNEPFAASMEVSDAPWATGHRLVRIGLMGREVSAAARGAANLVFLLDVSGSMDEPNKLPLVKESMRLLLGKLRPDDRVAIVVYAGASGLALPSTPVKQSREILAALDSLEPGGSTNGAMGIQLAYDIAKANLVQGGINRVILCTDGDFNVGVTGEGDLTRLISEKAKSGVFLTVLGFGMGNYKDATLEKLADQGNGNYGYIDSRREAQKLLVEQVSGTLVTIAKDVKLQVEFNPAQVASYRLIGYENRLLKKEDFNNDAVDAGEIGAGHTVTALYEVVPTSQAMGEGSGAMGTPAVDTLKYQQPANRNSKIENRNSRELLTLKVRYKEPAGAVSRKLEFPLVDGGKRFADASADFKFAAAVAEFGMILRGSPHKGAATLEDVKAWAEEGTDGDTGGYRSEFVELVKQAQALMR